MAGTGPMPKRSGSTPAVANVTKRPSGVSPRSRACAADITMTAAAPSLVCEELPAVTVPLAWKAGRSLASASADVSRRGPSSTANAIWRVIGLAPLPFEPSTSAAVTGTISSVKRPASIAAIARWWLRSANASCSSREIADSRAWFSATRPVDKYTSG